MNRTVQVCVLEPLGFPSTADRLLQPEGTYSHSTGTRSASPASVDKLHGLHGQRGGHDVVCIVSADSDHHQPI